jgi:hypothetical protein
MEEEVFFSESNTKLSSLARLYLEKEKEKEEGGGRRRKGRGEEEM